MLRQTFLAALLAGLSWGALAATVVASSDLESGTSGWTGAYALVPNFGNSYLSSDATAGNAVTFSFTVAANTVATGAQVSVLFGAVDSWDNGNAGYGPDYFNVALDGNSKFSAVFDNYQNLGPTTAAGLTSVLYGQNIMGSGYNDAVYQLTVNLGTLSAGTHTLTFFASGAGWQGGGDESFALDNLKVTGTVTAVPEPESLALALAGVAVVGVAARRRQR